MLIKIKKTNHLITALEGTGDNLTPQDIDDGYVDYINTNVYELDDYELVEKDGGMLLLDKPYAEYTEKELVYLLQDYWNELGEYEIIIH